MSTLQRQRQIILKQAQRFPRCVTHKTSRPVTQFYSWKNYVNADIDNIYSRIQKHTRNLSALSQPRKHRHEGNAVGESSAQLGADKCESQRQVSDFDRRCYSKVEMGTNTPMKQFEGVQTDRMYDREFSEDYVEEVEVYREQDQQGLKRDDKTTLISLQNERSKRTARPPKISNHLCYNCENARKNKQLSPRSREQGNLLIENLSNRGASAELQKKNEGRAVEVQVQTENKLEFSDIFSKEDEYIEHDQYHKRIKQEERLYLINKFIAHYEKMHGRKTHLKK